MTVKIADRGPEISAVIGLFLALSTVATILRCYCRALVVKSFGTDDWFAVIAYVFFVFTSTFAIASVYHGSGQHVTAIPPDDFPLGLKWWWLCLPVYVVANMALRLSIALFLLRITTTRLHKFIIWATVVLFELYGIFFFILWLLQCQPSAHFWTRLTGAEGMCIDPQIMSDAMYGYSAVSCLADWALAVLPVVLIWDVQLNPRTKLVVGTILAVGAIGSTATVLRIPYIKNLSNQTDFLYATSDIVIWSITETGIGITASAVATLRPIFRTFFSRSNLMGNTTLPPPPNSNPTFGKSWPGSSGYLRQQSSHGVRDEKMVRRTDEESGPQTETVGVRGVMTLIAGADLHLDDSGKWSWRGGGDRETDRSSAEEGSWKNKIRKTTVIRIGS